MKGVYVVYTYGIIWSYLIDLVVIGADTFRLQSLSIGFSVSSHLQNSLSCHAVGGVEEVTERLNSAIRVFQLEAHQSKQHKSIQDPLLSCCR